MSNKVLLIGWIFVLILAGCAGGGAASATPQAVQTEPPVASGPAPTPIPPSALTPIPSGGKPDLPAGLSGKWVFAPGDGSIWVQDSLTGQPHPVVKASKSLFADSPAFSPDGTRIAFKALGYDAQGAQQNSISIMNVDGSQSQIIAKPPDVKSAYYWPAFSPDGKWVYYTDSIASTGSLKAQIERVPAGGGASEKVVDNGQSGVLSPDGKKMAFIRFNYKTFAGALVIADANGQNEHTLLADTVFRTIAAPHFSSDGQWILYAASGPPITNLHGLLTPQKECAPQLLCLLAEPAYADGLPWDLWRISVDGSRYEQLTNVGADSPWPVWSRDGKYIAFYATTGIYLLDVNTRVINEISHNGGHGVFDWWSAP